MRADDLLMAAVLANKPTIPAVAAAYALHMAQGRAGAGPEFWSPLHDRICAALWPDVTDQAVRMRKLDAVKKQAWKVYDTMVATNEKAG